MTTFEFDMAFEVLEVVAGLERLFGKLGIAWSCERHAPADVEYALTLPDGHCVWLSVQPLPAARMPPVAFFPRTLLAARTDNGGDLTDLRRAVVLAFLRVTG